MARMFPDIVKTRVVFASGAEERFYNLCRQELDDSWRVFYSVTLSTLEQQEGMKDNEADFVLYHPSYGVLVVEVKGGRIRYNVEKDAFFTINRHGESFQIKNPFQQALVWKSRFLRVLRNEGIKVPVSHSVCFPSVAEKEIPSTAAVEPGIIIGRERMQDVDRSIKSIVKKSQPEKYLNFDDVGEKLEKLLVGSDFSTRLHIRDYIDSHESRLKDVETIHETLITPLSGSLRLGIEGEAGTGKTMLAMLLARKFRDEGKSVLVLTSNPQLNVFLRQQIQGEVTVKTYQEAAWSFGVDLLSPPESYEGSKQDWIQYEAPDRFGKAVEAGDAHYDVLICDESQDAQPFWWEAMEKLLKKDEESRMYIFFDRSQGVFGSGDSDGFEPEEVLPVKAPYFPLVHNYRTTAEIAAFSREFRTGQQILQSHSARLGYVPELITYESEDDCRQKLSRLFRKLIREEGLRPDEITLLSARKPDAEESVLRGLHDIARYPFHFIQSGRHTESVSMRGKVSVSTVAGFKGLETKIGILLNVSEYNMPFDNPLMASLMYVASTRAKHLLYIAVKKDSDKHKKLVEALAKVKATGAMVVDGSHLSQELYGTVIHYNPDRVGMIEVEDANSNKNSVMFFPYDVRKGGIDDVKVGTKLKFRPKVEGRVTIACDIKLAGSDS